MELLTVWILADNDEKGFKSFEVWLGLTNGIY